MPWLAFWLNRTVLLPNPASRASWDYPYMHLSDVMYFVSSEFRFIFYVLLSLFREQNMYIEKERSCYFFFFAFFSEKYHIVVCGFEKHISKKKRKLWGQPGLSKETVQIKFKEATALMVLEKTG
jgi:hypothetical protein